ncbi:hypothetical protein Ciccas_007589 [Cichlidogyrus casuarinus]|uniref:Uncharacterized protein n=1 Tax=Cichlidogyrus casuarinus TaxID=1844966 RepID=A0ABD2Q339_9PLAT
MRLYKRLFQPHEEIEGGEEECSGARTNNLSLTDKLAKLEQHPASRYMSEARMRPSSIVEEIEILRSSGVIGPRLELVQRALLGARPTSVDSESVLFCFSHTDEDTSQSGHRNF